MKRIPALLLGLLFLIGCASGKTNVAYQKSEEKPLILKEISLQVTDLRDDKEIISPAVKNMKTWAGIGGLINRLEQVISRDDDEPEEINIQQTFENALRQRLYNLGINAKTGETSLNTNLYVEIERFWLDLDGSSFKAEVTYRAKLIRDGKVIYHDRISGRIEKYNLLGEKTGWNILSEAFSSAINSLNVDFLTDQAQ